MGTEGVDTRTKGGNFDEGRGRKRGLGKYNQMRKGGGKKAVRCGEKMGRGIGKSV